MVNFVKMSGKTAFIAGSVLLAAACAEPGWAAPADSDIRMVYRRAAPELAQGNEPSHRLVLADEKGAELKTIAGMSYTTQWSPDGAGILLELDPTSEYGMKMFAVMDVNLKIRPVVGQGPDMGMDSPNFYNPVWSADGKSVVAVFGLDAVAWMSVDSDAGGFLCEKRADLSISGAYPSPDGKKMALAGYLKPRTSASENDVFITGPDCSNAVRITTDMPRPSQIRWSPDGKRLAFLNSPRDVITNKIIVIDADGKNRREFKEGYHLSVSWTEDGRLLTTWADWSDPSKTVKDRMCFLATIDPSTGKATVLRKEINAYFNDAEWRPKKK